MADLKEIVEMIDMVLEDTSVPKNVRRALEDAKKVIESDQPLDVKISSAVYSIQTVTDDPNLLMHSRMQLWNILSALEAVKK